MRSIALVVALMACNAEPIRPKIPSEPRQYSMAELIAGERPSDAAPVQVRGILIVENERVLLYQSLGDAVAMRTDLAVRITFDKSIEWAKWAEGDHKEVIAQGVLRSWNAPGKDAALAELGDLSFIAILPEPAP